jgi:hypothetical protein
VGPVYACFWYDTEDFLHPAADDAALRLADLHTHYGVPATFKVVGEVARALTDRGRRDVIEALARHDIGYHSDLHSAHPCVSEYCEPLSWEHGEALFRRLESQGYHDVQAVFGKPCSTFGQAGGAWAPQIYPVLRQWGVPTYVDEGPWVGLRQAPFWYMGLLHVFGLGPNRLRFALGEPGAELDAVALFHAAARRLAKADGGLLSIYFHPNEWVSDVFWDAVNFAGGHNPGERPVVVQHLASSASDRRPDVRMAYDCVSSLAVQPAEQERRFAAMGTFLHQVALADVSGVTCADLPRLYPDQALHGFVGRNEVLDATARWDDEVSFVRVERGWLSAGELLLAVCDLLTGVEGLAPGVGRRVARPVSVDGPRADVPPLERPVEVPFSSLAAAATRLHVACLTGDREPVVAEVDLDWPGGLAPVEPLPLRAARPLPAGVWVGPLEVRPEEFLLGCLRALRSLAVHGEPPGLVELRPTRFAPADYVTDAPDSFRWACFPEDFRAPRLVAHARRQAWTLKPAVLALA